MTIRLIIAAIAAYLIGSVSPAIIISRLAGSDVRSQGSGNAGATNMARVYGMKAGAAVLLTDALKTAVSVLIGRTLGGDVGIAAAGCGCIVGHCFPLYYGFKGGKGVSVGGMLAFVVDWRVGLCVIGVFLLAALLSKKVSLGSVCGALTIIVSAFAFNAPVPDMVLAAFAGILVVVQHRPNILRLIQGTEPDFRAGKSRK